MNIPLLFGLFCFILAPGWASGARPPFNDLTVRSIYGDQAILFNSSDLKITCSTCDMAANNEVKCTESGLVALNLEIANAKFKTSIPLNVSCKTGNDAKHSLQIFGTVTNSDSNNLNLSWARLSGKTIYFVNGTQQINKHTQNDQANSLFISNLKEKSWYQICIATLDGVWRTGIFVCKQILTDFSVTGPITNASIKSESDKIFISWANPQYKHDIPQGYVVHVKGPHNFCRIVIIKMMELNIPKVEKCLNNRTAFWSSLRTLEITELGPYSDFQIQIIPFNRNRASEKTVLSIKTKEGESDAVENIRLGKSSPGYLNIDFKSPSKPRGEIRKYRIKITSTKTDICGKKATFEIVAYLYTTHGRVDVGMMNKCGLYLVEVTPVNGWDQKGGFGKPASIPYEHFNGNKGTMNLNALFLSSNMARAKVQVSRNENQCLVDGIVFSIINKINKTDCMTKIMAHDNCDELKKNVQRGYDCPNMEFRKFNNRSSDTETYFRGVFRNKTTYKIGASRVYHKIENVTFSDISLDGNIEDCFTDCYTDGQYFGIRSTIKGGEMCQNWTNTEFKFPRSNICSMTLSSKPWCFGKKTWGYCNVAKCSTIDYGTGCVQVYQMPDYTNSVKIFWYPPVETDPIIGYLTLLHNTDHFCERYDLQLKYNGITEPQLNSSIKGFYLSCKSGQKLQFLSYRAHFSNLHQNRTFFVYIIPIISASKAGEIKNLTVQTALAKPDVPNIMSIKAESVGEMVLSWEKKQETKKHGAASNYVLKVRKGTEKRNLTFEHEGIRIEDMEMCSEYCFRLASVNKAGTSEFTKPICSHTLAIKPGNVRLDELKSGYMTNKKVRWHYLGSDQCLKTYQVEYGEKYKGAKNHILANESSVKLENLKRNAIYVVRVRANGLMKTINNESMGNYSTEGQFYTGNTTLEFSHYDDSSANSNKSFNITWAINEQVRGSIFEFMIVLNNSSDMCQNLIHLTCDSCEEPTNQMYLTPEQNDKRLHLLRCKPVENQRFQSENIRFHCEMKLKSPISKASVEIYGTNLMGVHLLNHRSPMTTVQGNNKKPIVIAMIIFALAFIVLFIGFVFRSRVYKRKTQRTMNTSLRVTCQRQLLKPVSQQDYLFNVKRISF